MRFEDALKAMREGKKVGYREEVYWIDEDNELVRYEYDDIDGYLDTTVIYQVHLRSADLLSENWIIINDNIVEQIFGRL